MSVRCRADYAGMQERRWAVIEDGNGPQGGFFVGIIGFWLALVFLSFGLQVPRRLLSGIVLAIGVICVASVMFVIVDLALPYQGLFGIRIHGLSNIVKNGNPVFDQPGPNPFDKVDGIGFRASLHDVHGWDTASRYKYISDNIVNWIDQAITMRKAW